MLNDYIVDIDRLNELTVHPNDNLQTGFSGTFCCTQARKIVKTCMDIYTEYNFNRRKISDEDIYNRAVEILHFNRILVSASDIRDGRINKVLKNT